MDPRAELEQLRKMKRLKELEAKSQQSSAPVPPQLPGVAPDSADKAAHPAQSVVDPNTKNTEEWIKKSRINPESISAQAMRAATITPEKAQQLGSMLVPGSSVALAGKSGLLGNLGAQALGGGTIAASQDPSLSPQDKLLKFLKGGALSLGVGALGKGISAAGSKIQDILMQKAAGVPYQKGIGTTMAEEGLFGTKSALQRQTGESLGRIGEKASGQVANIPGKISPLEATKPLAGMAKERMVGDVVPGSQAQAVRQIEKRAQELYGRGDLQPDQAWSFAKAAGKVSHKDQMAKGGIRDLVNQAEQAGYSQALKNKAEESGIPLAETFQRYSQMSKVRSALQDPNVQQSLIIPGLMGGAGGVSGFKSGGLAGALKGTAQGVAGAALLRSPLALSGAGRLSGLFGRGVDIANNPVLIENLAKKLSE